MSTLTSAPVPAVAPERDRIPVSAPARRLHGLDHLRALAIISVCIFHYSLFGHPPGLDTIGSFGWTGVDLFFVLSGYLIGGQLLSRIAKGQPISYGEFYFKRTLRILPAYLVVLLIYFTWPAFTERSQLPPLWKFLTFTQNLGMNLQHMAFSHAWSLCIEEQFYLILPLILLLLPNRRHAAWLLLILFLAGFGIRLFNWYHFIEPVLQNPDHKGFGQAYYEWIYYPTFTRLDGLLAGVTLAAIFHFRPTLWQRLTLHGNRLLLLSLLLLAGAWWVSHNEYQYQFRGAIFGYPLISLAYGVLVLAALSPTCILYKIPSRLTTFLAAISYSLYLVHKQLIHLTKVVMTQHGFSEDSYIVFGTGLLVAFLGGWLLHLIVEKPFLRLRDRILRR